MISEKQQKILAFPYSKYSALICDGAVRSGKTSIMTWAFIDWAMRQFCGQRFGICGKTVDSAVKNIIEPFFTLSLTRERYALRWRRGEKMLEVRRGHAVNWFEVFGGKDERSFTTIQGRTLAGVMLDEVALMPRSFVEQAIARCSVDGARLWFSCNPDSLQHWFYREWIQKHDAHNALYLHFALTDNPSLSEERRRFYQTTFAGVFYDRYVRGLWVAAEGLIYPMFGEANLADTPPRGSYYISVDYGTMNPFSAGLWCWDGTHATRVREYYHAGRETRQSKTDDEYYTELERLAGDLPIKSIIIDPSAASMIEVIRRRRRFAVQKAVNDVLPGIATTARYLADGTLRVCRCCKDCIREFGLYRWEENSPADKPVKENDHAMDDTRYFVMTVLRRLRHRGDYVPLYQRRRP